MTFTRISQDDNDCEGAYLLCLETVDDETVCHLIDPSQDQTSQTMSVDEGIKVFCQRMQMVGYKEEYDFFVIDEQNLWEPSWGRLKERTKLTCKPIVL